MCCAVRKIILDFDLARLYRVTTGNLNKAVQRNAGRFPSDFMFQLSQDEAERLIFQFGRSKGRGGRRHRPYAFTEQGVAMLSSVLRSARAVDVNIAIMRAFVRLREVLASHKALARKLDDLGRKLGEALGAGLADEGRGERQPIADFLGGRSRGKPLRSAASRRTPNKANIIR